MLEAAKARNYQPVLEVAKTVSEHEVPQIVYHRFCRTVFTANLKRVLGLTINMFEIRNAFANRVTS